MAKNDPHPPGANLALIFLKLEPAPELPLPAHFNASCKMCAEPLERIYPTYCGRIKPYATFRCTGKECHLRLYLYDAPVTPLLLWSDVTAGVIRFDEFVEGKIAEREAKLKVRAERYGKETEMPEQT